MSEVDSDNEFVLIDEFDIAQADAERQAAELDAPWIRSDHPLYFCDTQTSLIGRSAALNAFAIENWYEILREYTFKTVWLPISMIEAQSLFSLSSPTIIINSNQREENTESNRLSIVENLAKRIDASIKLNFGDNGSAFLRLSTRSPKDSTALDGVAVSHMLRDSALWSSCCCSLSPRRNDHEDCKCEDFPHFYRQNRQIASYTAGMLQGLRIFNGEAAIKIISESHKIACDMEALLSVASSGENINSNEVTSVILREWIDMRLDHEFRIFVCRCDDDNDDALSKTKEAISEAQPSFFVTGITQYFHYIHFGFLKDGISNLTEEERQQLNLSLTRFIESKILPLAGTFLSTCKGLTESGSDTKQTAAVPPSEFVVDVGLVRVNNDSSSVAEASSIPSKESQKQQQESDCFFEIRGVNYRPMVIELNPFAPAATGGMLFDWKSDLGLLWRRRNRQTSLHGLPPFRIRDTIRESFEGISLLPIGYEAAINHAISLQEATYQ